MAARPRRSGNFNPRSREGSDSVAGYTSGLKIISIHAPARGATRINRRQFDNTIFQSTLPRGERRSKSAPSRRGLRISIHAPARGATRGLEPCFKGGQFQSTLPRGERPRLFGIGGKTVRISIHAPARGATRLICLNCRDRIISIHAPARGATANMDKPYLQN